MALKYNQEQTIRFLANDTGLSLSADYSGSSTYAFTGKLQTPFVILSVNPIVKISGSNKRVEIPVLSDMSIFPSEVNGSQSNPNVAFELNDIEANLNLLEQRSGSALLSNSNDILNIDPFEGKELTSFSIDYNFYEAVLVGTPLVPGDSFDISIQLAMKIRY